MGLGRMSAKTCGLPSSSLAGGETLHHCQQSFITLLRYIDKWNIDGALKPLYKLDNPKAITYLG